MNMNMNLYLLYRSRWMFIVRSYSCRINQRGFNQKTEQNEFTNT